jgi:anti-anti-sigma factor
LHGARGGVHVLRFIGDIRYPLAPAVTELSNRVLAGGELTGVVVDLTETTSVDSTNLGMLARLAVRVNARCGHPLTVVADARDIRDLLDSMGISSVCELVDRRPDGGGATTAVADAGALGETELASIMLDAHRALMELSRSNREQFRDVIAMLERAAGQPP